MVAPAIGIAIGSLIGGAVSILSFGPGFGDLITQNLYAFFESRIVTGVDLVRALKKGHITQDKFNELMDYNGYNSEQREILLKSSTDKLSVAEILTLWFRYKDDTTNTFGVNETWLNNTLDATGIDPDFRNQVIEANRPVPNLDDIIRFAVRDVYEPEQARLAGLFEDMPEEFIREAEKRGLQPEDTKKYWAAHWFIPSTNQMIEMSQRLFDHPDPEVRFTQQDMLGGFKLADISPAFRKRLLAISKHPIGRVDIRRFDRMGVFGEGEERRQNLIRRYLELGYNQSDAELQTRFTMEYNDKAEESGSVAEVLRFYREGVFKENKKEMATAMLEARGVQSERIEHLLALEDMKMVDQEEQDAINRVKEQFLEGTISDESGLRAALNKIELTTSDLNKLVDKFLREKEQTRKRMSLSDADRLRRLEIITEQEWKEIYRAKGIFEADIQSLNEEFSFTARASSKSPTKDDLIQWATNNLITTDEFISEMSSLGYNRRYIDLYALSAGLSIDQEG